MSRAEKSGLCVVVGSGPAGVACAKALLAQGRKVRLLDGGITLEPERAALVEKLRASSPEKWSATDLQAYQAGMNPDVGGVPLKLVYGSDFAYREADVHLGVQYDNVGLRPSLARGGLSTVWGAAMMPYAEADVRDWPLPLSALAEHYAAVLRFTGLSATRDSLANHFPLYTNTPTELRPSAQASLFLKNLERNRDRLARAGIQFGRSRLAVRGNVPNQNGGCTYCRLCMYGCPYGYIYNAADTLTELQKNPNFTYEPGVIIQSARETGSTVELSGYDRADRKARTWSASRVFLAAGAIPTTGILLRSLGAYEQTAWIQDSQYFLLPMLLFRKAKGATTESLHGLSQAFLEIGDPTGETPTAHLQVYSNSDLINQAVADAFGPLRQPLRSIVKSIQERLLIVQGFIHSKHSSRIAVRLEKKTGSPGENLRLRAELNPEARRKIFSQVARLCRNIRSLGALPLPMLLKIAEPGRSFHSGGSFPMSRNPQGFQTDLLGRPPNWKRLHAVDSTVLPGIPATTITLSAMANAHRIGWEAAQIYSKL